MIVLFAEKHSAWRRLSVIGAGAGTVLRADVHPEALHQAAAAAPRDLELRH